jgi:hypothetical protein
MFHQLSIVAEFSTAPGCYGLYSAAIVAACGIDSECLAPRMPVRAALERAARFVSAAVWGCDGANARITAGSNPLLIVE